MARIQPHANCARRTRNAQSSSVHRCAGAAPPLGSVPRIGKFELGDQSPKLNLVTVRQPPGPLGCGRVVWAVKVDHAPQLAVFVQNECTIMWHRKSPRDSILPANLALWRVITSYLLGGMLAAVARPNPLMRSDPSVLVRAPRARTLRHDDGDARTAPEPSQARCLDRRLGSAIANANGLRTFASTTASTSSPAHPLQRSDRHSRRRHHRSGAPLDRPLAASNARTTSRTLLPLPVPRLTVIRPGCPSWCKALKCPDARSTT